MRSLEIDENLKIAAKLDDLIINHHSFHDAIVGIENCIKQNKFYKAPRGCLLVANGGFGKTTVGKVLACGMPQTIERTGRLITKKVPFLVATIPPSATIKRLASVLLRELGDPNPMIGDSTDLTERLCALLIQYETVSIFLDEFHHLFKLSKTHMMINKEVADWIKTIADRAHVCICLIGTEGFADFFYRESQYKRRFPQAFKIEPLKTDNRKDGGNIAAFFNEIRNFIENETHIRFHDKFDTYPFYEQLYLATAGIPAFVKMLCQDLILIALENTEDAKIHTGYFSMAWKKGNMDTVCITKKDPFLMSSSQIAEYFRG